MSVTCWVRDTELREFVKTRCGVETLTDRHRLKSFRLNGEGDVFLVFEPTRTKTTKRRPR